MTRRLSELASLIIAASMLALAGCAAEPTTPQARPVTTEESQLLATARFRNFDAGTRTVSTTLRDAGTDLGLTGWVDYRSGAGLAVLSEADVASYLLTWTIDTVGAKPTDAVEAAAVLADAASTPTDGFSSGPMNAQGALHPLLAILIDLGNDRPDNPLLLQTGGALWLREDRVGDTAVTVFTGPSAADEATAEVVDPNASSTRYWLDADGLMLRFEVRLGAEWVTVDFGSAENTTVTAPFDTGDAQ